MGKTSHVTIQEKGKLEARRIGGKIYSMEKLALQKNLFIADF